MPPLLEYKPTIAPQTIAERLSRLLPPGPINGSGLEREVSRLEQGFYRYAATYPHGLWAPGLAITNEMRGLTECRLPMSEIQRVFNRFFSAALTFTPFLGASIIHTSPCWLDALQRLQSLVNHAKPSGFGMPPCCKPRPAGIETAPPPLRTPSHLLLRTPTYRYRCIVGTYCPATRYFILFRRSCIIHRSQGHE